MDIEQRVSALETLLATLSSDYYRDNFVGYEQVSKDTKFTTRLTVPHYDILPSACSVAEVAESGGKLYIASATNTWTVVGTQT